MASTTTTNVPSIGAMRCQAEVECSAEGMLTPFGRSGPHPNPLPQERKWLPRLESPSQDEADAKAGQRHHLGPLAGILSQISQKIVERPQIVIAVDRLFGCIRHIAAGVHDRFSELKP